MSERQSNSQEQLQARQARLSGIIESRQQLEHRLHARIGEGGIENTPLDRKLGRIKDKVGDSLQRARSSLAEVKQTIAMHGESLMARAQNYLDQITIYEAIIRENVEKGLYTPEITQRRQQQLQEFRARGETDPELKLGLKLLRQRQEKAKEKQAVPPTKEEEKLPPTLKIWQKTGEVQLKDWEKPKVVSGIRRAVLTELAKSANQVVSRQTLHEVAINYGSKDDYPVNGAIFDLRAQIEPDPKNPQIIVTVRKGTNIGYSLKAEVIFEDEEKARAQSSQKKEEARRVFEFTLPDGQIVRIMGKMKAKTLEKLLEGFGENRPIETDELALTLYGIYNRDTYTLTQSFIARLRKDLQPFNWRIIQPVGPPERVKGRKAAYHLKKIQVSEEPPETIQEVEITPPGEEEIFTAAIPPTVALPQDIIEMPYVPTEEEKRSEEETQILNVIVSLFSANLHNPRIRFDDVNRELSPQIQRKSLPAALGGKPLYRIYSAAELKDKFASAYRKFREEAAISHIRETWTEEEKSLWTKIEFAVGRLSGGNFDDFLRRVKLEIDRSINQFYREHPPSQGRGPVRWVEA